MVVHRDGGDWKWRIQIGTWWIQIGTWWLMESAMDCIVQPVSISLWSCLAALQSACRIRHVGKKRSQIRFPLNSMSRGHDGVVAWTCESGELLSILRQNERENDWDRRRGQRGYQSCIRIDHKAFKAIDTLYWIQVARGRNVAMAAQIAFFRK